LKNEFDLTSDKIGVLQGQLLAKANNCGWNHPQADVINLPTAANNARTCNLIEEYSKLTVASITAWAILHVVNQQTRLAQNNYNLYQCLFNTLTSEKQTSMELERTLYTVQGVVIAALFYKLMMTKADVDTQATIAITRTALTRLDEKMLELNSNVADFNEFVKLCRKKLSVRGAGSTDLLVNLFSGYKAAQDAKFVETISSVEEDYLYGKTPNLTDDQLMTQALIAYNVRVERKEWGARSPAEEMIVAMQAKIDDLKDHNLKVDVKKKKIKKKKKTLEAPKRPRADVAWKETNVQNKETISKNGQLYYWCKHHRNGSGLWVVHKPEDCRNRARDETEATPTDAADTRAMAAIAEMTGDDSDSGSESE
jgi:hypothetical protein